MKPFRVAEQIHQTYVAGSHPATMLLDASQQLDDSVDRWGDAAPKKLDRLERWGHALYEPRFTKFLAITRRAAKDSGSPIWHETAAQGRKRQLNFADDAIRQTIDAAQQRGSTAAVAIGLGEPRVVADLYVRLSIEMGDAIDAAAKACEDELGKQPEHLAGHIKRRYTRELADRHVDWAVKLQHVCFAIWLHRKINKETAAQPAASQPTEFLKKRLRFAAYLERQEWMQQRRGGDIPDPCLKLLCRMARQQAASWPGATLAPQLLVDRATLNLAAQEFALASADLRRAQHAVLRQRLLTVVLCRPEATPTAWQQLLDSCLLSCEVALQQHDPLQAQAELAKVRWLGGDVYNPRGYLDQDRRLEAMRSESLEDPFEPPYAVGWLQMEGARRAMLQGNFDGARRLYRGVLRDHPKLTKATYALNTLEACYAFFAELRAAGWLGVASAQTPR